MCIYTIILIKYFHLINNYMKTKSNYTSKKSFGSKISYNKCRNVWDWIIQISLWIASVCLLLYEFLVKKKGRVKTLTQEEIDQANNYFSNKENTNTLNADISLQVDMKNNEDPLIQTQTVNAQVSLL